MKIILIILYITTIFINLFAQGISDRINLILNEKIPQNTEFSISIFNLHNDKVIYQNNEKVQLIPASTAKLYTTACALLLLGFDYKLTSKFLTDDNNIKDGIINGNLFFKGEGNPKFSSSNLESMIKSLKAQRISEITKDLIIDDSFFDNILLRDHWIEDEGTRYPLPPISAVTIDNNTNSITIKGGAKKRHKTSFYFSNFNEYFSVVNQSKTVGKRLNIRISSIETETGEKIYIKGQIPANKQSSFRLIIKNPSKYLAAIIKQYLKKNDIQLKGKVAFKKSGNYLLKISEHEFPLIDIIFETNKKSNNFFAEHLFKIIGGKYSGTEGAAYDAAQSIFTFLKSNNLYEKNFSLVDGSGLSRLNKFSSNALTKLLTYIYYLKDEFEPFYNSLGIAGKDGTVRNRLNNTIAANNCHAKTGTLNGVVALAGYVNSKNNCLLAFSINFNFNKLTLDYYRDIADEIVNILAETDTN